MRLKMDYSEGKINIEGYSMQNKENLITSKFGLV
jgi:hypothetical protein